MRLETKLAIVLVLLLTAVGVTGFTVNDKSTHE